ncbi:STAS domain-containing protein [Actinoplanes sp. NEAU-A12]|uniref:Anti-sigma factor antagonist n=1 Tax=Actinoplanes sandaracinus TaxID=3045177 RepID=A0ABT6WXY7_9ACTN|nr:STAS domain-containing protein [Actinoplanes sandaracinus]MDI6104607.1 STAS domain-containing protein [Actinoplanes sandaracinus]
MSAEHLLETARQDRLSLEIDSPRPHIDVRAIAAAGELDAINGAKVHQVVCEVLLQQRPRRIEIDLREVRFLDSAGIRTLLRCHADARRVNCELTLTDAHPTAYRALQITGLLAHFGLTGTRDQQDR